MKNSYRILFWISLFLLSHVSSAQGPELPTFDGLDDLLEQKMEKEDAIPKSRMPVNIDIPIEKTRDSMTFDLTFHFPGELKLILNFDGNIREQLLLSTEFQALPRKKSESELSGKTFIEISKPDESFRNQVLRIRPLNISYIIRPPFLRYTEHQINKNLGTWEELPDALTHAISVEIIRFGKNIRIYFDGRFLVEYPDMPRLVSVHLQGGSGATAENRKVFKNIEKNGDWEAIRFAGVGGGGSMNDAKLPFKSGFHNFNGIPMYVSAPESSADLSKAKCMRGLYELIFDPYVSRSAFERMPESFLTSVPKDYYDRACILFALDPDSSKDRAFTIRMTRYITNGGRGEGYAVTDISLPGDGQTMPDNIRQVGTVTLKEKNIPLYLGEFPISIGDIWHIIENDPVPNLNEREKSSLDFELLGRRSRGMNIYGTWQNYPDSRYQSAVNVFGVTLRRAPAILSPKPSETGNIFHNMEKPETKMQISARKDAVYRLEWIISDTYGEKELKRGEKEFPLKAGEQTELTLSLDMEKKGHYNLNFKLSENGVESPIMTHNASFALLGPDTRLASPAESPFGIWWFTEGAHYAPYDPDLIFSILNKAGIRRTSFMPLDGEYGKKMDAARKKYKIILNQFPWIMNFPKGGKEEVFEAFHTYYDKMIADNPDTKYVLIFHESFGGNTTPELFGKTVSPGDNPWAVKQATWAAEFFRKNYPHLKLCIGNSGLSTRATANLLRNGFPAEYFDFVGIEAVGIGEIPEMLSELTPAGTFLPLEAARKYGKKLRATGCFEFTSRPARVIGLKKHAEHYIRDALVGLAFGYETLGIAGLPISDAYWQSLYGDASILTQDLYPRPLYTAYATLTRMLDRIEFSPKRLDTGSNTTYALEFKRKDGSFVYALWVPSGTAEAEMHFPENTRPLETGFFGDERRHDSSTFKIKLTTAPVYLQSPEKAIAIKHLRMIPEEIKGKFELLTPMDDASKWTIPNTVPVLGNDIGWRQPGKITIQTVTDEELGKCVEVRLHPEGVIPDIVSEYTYIQLKEPLAIPGTPDTLSLLVKGDGGWGQVLFELQSANGISVRSGGRPGCGKDALSRITFTGWDRIWYPISGKGIRPRTHMASNAFWQGDRPGSIEFPLKLTGLYLVLNRKALNPSEMKDVAGVIRLKELGIITHSEFQTPPTSAK